MNPRNKVFIATSLDGHIADKNGGLEWLDMVPNPDQVDTGFYSFMESVDALVMGRTTFETVIGFDVDWPYNKHVFVLSRTLESVPDELKDKVSIINGSLNEVLQKIHSKGYYTLYIDGGRTIQSFLKEDLIDEMVITTIPVLLGGGPTLFGELTQHLEFELVSSTVELEQLSKKHYKRKR